MKLIRFIFLFSAAVSLVGCGLGSAEKGRKPSADWSKGLLLEERVGGAAAMTISEGGERIHFSWPAEAGNELLQLHYLQLDSRAEVTAERILELPPGKLFSPSLLPAENGGVHLFWILRPGGTNQRELWTVALDNFGNEAGGPHRVSPSEQTVGDYAVVTTPLGVTALWEDRGSTSLYGASLSESDPAVLVPELIVTSGAAPNLQVDEDGGLYATWVDGTAIFYANFFNGKLRPTNGTRVADYVERQGDTIEGPIIGVAGDWATILWSIYSRSGEEGGTGRTEYVSFPIAEPALNSATRMTLRPVEDQPYETYAGGFHLTQLAPPAPSISQSSAYIFGPSVAAGDGAELAVALSAVHNQRLNSYIQIALAVFDEGEFIGYQMASKTEAFSQEAMLMATDAGEMHLGWRDGSGGRKLFYATTAPEAQARIDRLEGSDVANALLAGTMEAATGILFFPLALGWLLPGVLLLGIWKLKKENASLKHPVTRLLLVVSVLMYQIAKLLFLPTMLSYVPFSAWLDLPASGALLLRIGTPVLFLGLGFFVAELRRRRRPDTSAPFYFAIACGIDALLTLAVYGVNFLGVF